MYSTITNLEKASYPSLEATAVIARSNCDSFCICEASCSEECALGIETGGSKQ